jgi:hypothetical protein
VKTTVRKTRNELENRFGGVTLGGQPHALSAVFVVVLRAVMGGTISGALQMTAFYLGGWAGDWLALFDSTLIYAVVFLTLAALAAGRIAGLDRRIEPLRVGGEPLIERFPKPRCLLG